MKDRIQESTKQTKEFEIARKKFDNDIQERDEEISRLRDHNRKLLLQIKKAKDKVQHNQQLEEENRDLQKELSCKYEESSSLKRVNQELLEKVKDLKERDPKNQGNQYDVVNSNYKE